MTTYILTDSAERDIEQILTYTLVTWGADQFEIYRDLIIATLESVNSQPKLIGSKNCDDLVSGCRSYRCGKHAVFYVVRDEKLIVLRIRILHERMLPVRYL